MFEGLEVESLVCQRGEKAIDTCEIFQSMLWQKKSIKQFPLSSLKEARVEEYRHKGKTMTTCRLLTTEGELRFGVIGGGKTLEKRKIVSKINAFLQNPNQLKLSVQESLDFFMVFLGIFMSGFALCLFCSCFYSVFLFYKKVEP